ncbi:olee1-like protein [Magnolia sinica]|uniref:olee1-like protein n=1 Tax=Magnolia sinica TaxID=86752 RepID=UPI00265A532A|nr:olee1-like protein [Magnolia sinica]
MSLFSVKLLDSQSDTDTIYEKSHTSLSLLVSCILSIQTSLVGEFAKDTSGEQLEFWIVGYIRQLRCEANVSAALEIFPEDKSNAEAALDLPMFSYQLKLWRGSSKPIKTPSIVEGKVYCDTYRIRFKTRVSENIAGAKVRIECIDRSTGLMTYSIGGLTDESGTYWIPVEGDHQADICEVVAIGSNHPNCNEVDLGRDRARVLLTKNNGISSHSRYVNALGFMKKETLDVCPDIFKELGMAG